MKIGNSIAINAVFFQQMAISVLENNQMTAIVLGMTRHAPTLVKSRNVGVWRAKPSQRYLPN